jgi:hypothetical protein
LKLQNNNKKYISATSRSLIFQYQNLLERSTATQRASYYLQIIRTTTLRIHPSNRKPKFPLKTSSQFSTSSPRYLAPTPRFSAPPAIPYPPHHTLGRNTTLTITPRDSLNNTNLGHMVACQICGKFNHIVLDCYHRMNYAYQGRHPPPQLQAMVAHHHADIDSHEWLVDSGTCWTTKGANPSVGFRK